MDDEKNAEDNKPPSTASVADWSGSAVGWSVPERTLMRALAQQGVRVRAVLPERIEEAEMKTVGSCRTTGVILLAVCAMIAGVDLRPAAAITITSSATLANPNPGCPPRTCTFSPDNTVFTWGASDTPSSLAFEGGVFPVPQTSGTDFVIGKLVFHNGAILLGTQVNTIDLILSTIYDQGEITEQVNPPKAINFTLTTTPNLGNDPIADADSVYFTAAPNFGAFNILEGTDAPNKIEIKACYNPGCPPSYLDPPGIFLGGFGRIDDPSTGFVAPVTLPPSAVLIFFGSGVAWAVWRWRPRRSQGS